MPEPVRYEARDGIGVITLDRPDNRNSMTPELLDAFARASGLGRASELLFTGRLVDGAEAERLGIVNRAVASARVMDEAMEMARAIAANAPFAVRATKAALRRGLGLEPRAAARAEAYDQAASLAMEDAREGMSALLAKRKPTFTGR